MNSSTINSLAGMNSVQQKLDTIANNIANLNTTGYKSTDLYFSEILTSQMQQPEEFNLTGRLTPMGLDQGHGANAGLTMANFGQGSKLDTGLATDFMIAGENAFFTVVPSDPYDDTQIRYTRDGNFHLDANRYLVTSNGDFVLNSDGESIQIPEGGSFQVFGNGLITVNYANGENEELGSLMITKINTPQVLQASGNNQYMIPEDFYDNIDTIIDAEFDIEEGSDYQVYQGSLEASNVDMAKEMVQLNEAQRQYQLLSRSLSISDQMFGIANNLRG